MKLYGDGFTIQEAKDFIKEHPSIAGFTTNPSLMRAIGVKDYVGYSKELIKAAENRPVSFEVFADEFGEMYRQAKLIASWGENVYVKIPITNTRGESSVDLMARLANEGVKINATAIMLDYQVRWVSDAIKNHDCIISIFCGRIADTGINPSPIVFDAMDYCSHYPKQQILWASVREVYNLKEALDVGCHIVTAPMSILKKASLIGKDLEQFSLETVQMFYNDAVNSGYTL